MSFTTKKECYESKFRKVQTNSRYPHFKQLHYTVGDEDQFDECIEGTVSIQTTSSFPSSTNLFSELKMEFWMGYKYQERMNVINTFRYIFYKFKKGIFIRIEKKEVKLFLPLSNANFINEWSDFITRDFEVFKKVSALDGRPYQEKNINKYVRNWYSNNCLVRYEYPINESDTNVSNIHDYFVELCKHRDIPDIEFFVNKRDFPLLTTNYSEPYYDIWGENKPLVSHKYDSYLPILSMSKTDEFADVLIPTHEDWARVCQKEGKYYVDSRVGTKEEEELVDDFKSKIPTAVFRGSSTGDGFTVETNQRLKISYLSSLKKKDKDGNLILDCGITKWNSRCKKLKNSTKLQVIDPASFPFGLANFLSLEEQRKYKYIVHIDGHVSAFRLSSMLSLNCCMLIVESKWKLWYSDILQPYEHYIPIKENLSDLFEQLEWCKNNDESCEFIAQNAFEFAKTYLGKEGLFDYGEKVLHDLKTFMELSSTHVVVRNEDEEVTPFVFSTTEQKEDPEEIFSNRNVNVIRYGGVVKKIPKTKKKHKYCFEVLNNLAKKYPNFCKTFGVENEEALVMEFVDGIKFYDYLEDKRNFDFRVYLDIIYELSVCLELSQRDCLFVHNDLTSWNIILRRNKNSVTPVIIDYDKAHVIDENYIHRGSVNKYKFSSIQDVLSLVFTTLYQIITNHTLNPFEIKSVLTIANFVSGTEFYAKKFVNIYQLKSYLYSMKKHSSLLYSDKKDLENLHPGDFCEYLRRNIRHNFKGRHPPERKKEVTSSSFDFDKYIEWSPTAFELLKTQIKKEKRMEQTQKASKNAKKREANIRTFLYKYPE